MGPSRSRYAPRRAEPTGTCPSLPRYAHDQALDLHRRRAPRHGGAQTPLGRLRAGTRFPAVPPDDPAARGFVRRSSTSTTSPGTTRIFGLSGRCICPLIIARTVAALASTSKKPREASRVTVPSTISLSTGSGCGFCAPCGTGYGAWRLGQRRAMLGTPGGGRGSGYVVGVPRVDGDAACRLGFIRVRCDIHPGPAYGWGRCDGLTGVASLRERCERTGTTETPCPIRERRLLGGRDGASRLDRLGAR